MSERKLPEGIPNRFVDVLRKDQQVKEIRVLEGQLLVCLGCCCGNTDRGMPELPLAEFKQQWKERGIRLRIHLSISGCLGPCSLANVILILFGGQSIWLHSINTPQHVTAVYDYLERMLAAQKYFPPDGMLADCHFNRFIFDTASAGKW
ncbi:(2Fe-2S) ferredoxin domain-containing protein [bacterium]|nr:(2Fe-2S) ferredoxin domain-containing protein [bacterium]MCI0602270.1 (2Fe-2S) ferredoxin domain-containing protein [bacterium]